MSRGALDITATADLAIGAIFGLAGTMVPDASWRQTFWAIDGAALVVASALLTMKFARKGRDCVAAGFLAEAEG